MKLKEPVNESYAANIVELRDTFPLDGLDNLVGARFMGYTALIPKNYGPGLYVMFPPETQLSEKFCRENNLYREPTLNANPKEKGYAEKNRRVKALKLRGNVSSCMILPLSCFDYLGVDTSEFKEGDIFDHIGDEKICEKYVIKSADGTPATKTKMPKSRVDSKLFPLHVDSQQWFKHDKEYADKFCIITQKIHGVSWRGANILVNKKLTWKDKIAKKLGIHVPDQEYALIAGSRKVTKDPNNPNQNHFYKQDIWSIMLDEVKDAIPKDHIVYGELVGYTPDRAELQKSYTYDAKPGKMKLYVYRVAQINPDGDLVDYSWDGVKAFCNERGLEYTPELTRCFGRELNVDNYMNKRYYDAGFRQSVPLSDSKLPDEGICIRAEGIIPSIAKAKAPEFLVHESSDLDSGNIDIESEQS